MKNPMDAVPQTLPTDPAKLAEMVRSLQAQVDALRIVSVTENDAADLQLLREELAKRDGVIEDLNGEIAAKNEVIAEQHRELAAAKAGLQLKVYEIEKLKAEVAKLRRMKFGQSSERFVQQLDQLELRLEDLESDVSQDAAANPELAAALEKLHAREANRSKEKNRPARKPIPPQVPRERIVIPAPDSETCSACGGKMGELGVDVAEVLDYVPAHWKAVRYERVKCACSKCDAISQAPSPDLPILRGKAGPGLLAHVAVSKYCDHLPLYRQSEIYARDGIEISRSTLADWIGQCSNLLAGLHDRIAAQVLGGAKVHGDDTPVRLLKPGLGRTATGRLWVYVRDDRNWQPPGDDGRSADPPAAVYYFSPDRKGERPAQHLAAFGGYLQADGYAGYDQLYRDGRPPGPIVEVACWAHVRRKINDVFKARGSKTAAAGLEVIKRMYAIEETLRGLAPEARLAGRAAVRAEVAAFFAWGDAALARLSRQDALAKAIAYAATRRTALTRFLDDGRLEIDNNRAENSLRAIAVGRKNWLFAGSEGGGERAARFFTLFETCKLNGVEPWSWLRDVLKRIGEGHPNSRLDELLPWNWKDPGEPATTHD